MAKSRVLWMRIISYGGLAFLLIAVYLGRWHLLGAWNGMSSEQKTVAQRVQQFGVVADQRWRPFFQAKGVSYPPAQIVLVGIKKENRLEVYAGNPGQPVQFIRSYPILCASGHLGPKLREGDRQVPEGLYRIARLNPNSLYHLSLRVSYPNDFDRAQAAKEGRTQLGGDIMIHGKNVSIGCLAMGDEAAEDLFVLAERTGIKKIRVILTPVDFRKETITAAQVGQPPWVDGLYAQIAGALHELGRL